MVERLRGEETDEPNWRLRIAIAVTTVLAVVALYSLLYRWMMGRFAGEDVSLVHALQVVIEALTTAGFGGDTEFWREHDALAALVILMNLSGVILVFLAIPLFAVPMFREAFGRELPTETTLRNHVIICGHSAVDDILRDELKAAGKPHLFVESDPDKVKYLLDQDEDAILGDVERVSTLERANAEQASALVADVDDETNPTVILSANRINPNLQIVSVVNTREAAPYHRYAGADDVVVSKESLGESLGMRSMKTVSERFQEAVGLSNGPEFHEYLVTEGSDLVGRSIEDIDLFDNHRITIIGGWFGAKFLVSPPPETIILENSILLVSGVHEELEAKNLRRLPEHQGHPDRVVICGYGDVGAAATTALKEADIETTVVDLQPQSNVDVVGNITKRDTLAEANLDGARSIILAVDDDVTSIYSTILIKQIYPETEVIARSNDDENLWKLYNAGADYVLSLSAITGEILASILVDDSDILTPYDEFEFVRTTAPAIVGQSLVDADIRNLTGSTVVSVERDAQLLTELGPEFVIEEGDVLVAAGGNGATDRFEHYVTTGTVPEG